MPRSETRWRPSRRLGHPETPGCVTVVEPNGALTPPEIFALMTQSTDWRPAPDPRTPMAFAIAPGWVFKSDLSRRRLDRERVVRDVSRMIDLTAKVGVWHPAKTWFLLRLRRRHLVCSATPLLIIPPKIGVRRLLARLQKRGIVARAAACGLRLDERRRNFGYDPGNWRLYYLDDEVYPLHR
jgi:hypothetical protein